MLCPRCGKSIENSRRGCPSCGGGVAAAILTPPPGMSSTGRIPSDAVDAPTIAGGLDSSTMAGGTSFPADPPTTFIAPDSATTFGDAGDRTRIPGSESWTEMSGGATPTDVGFGGEGSDHGPLNIGQVFGTRYHIIHLLGIGGMGAVYQAWDDELGVAVAIKVIRPEVMADPSAAADIEKRFKRELLLARQVTHKNVVRIHDLGEINGIKYITMPYVDGADLSTVLKREGKLPVPRALRIARSVVAGLVEAHKAGVVHRDLKPANIMISVEDEAMIMDFGIARSTGSPTAKAVPGNTTIVRDLKRAVTADLDSTVYGAAVGTVQDMAPEPSSRRP